MVWAGTHQRQAQGHIHPLVQAQVLHRDQPLVVVHRHHHIKCAGFFWGAAGPHKYRVRRLGAFHVQALRPRDCNGGGNVLDLFAPHMACLARVGIEPSHRNARRPAQRLGERLVGDANGLQHMGGGNGVDRVAQGHMDADQHSAQRVVGQHHAHGHLLHGHPRMARRFGLQQLGMPGEIYARQMQRLLVQRRGHHAVDFATQCRLRGPLHTGCCGAPRFCLHLPKRQRPRQAWQGPYRQAPWRHAQGVLRRIYHRDGQCALTGPLQQLRRSPQGCHVAHGKAAMHAVRRISKRLGDDFRPNTRRIALGDGQQWGSVHKTFLYQKMGR